MLNATPTLDSATAAAVHAGSDRPGALSAIQALVVVAVVVAAGEAFGAGFVDIALRAAPGLNLALVQACAPAVVVSYQLALTWFGLKWLLGPGFTEDVALRRPVMGPLGWVGIIFGLYALKAILAIAAMWAAGAAASAGGTTTGAASFGVFMRMPVWPVMLLAGIVAAVVEEILYRGYLSRTLEQTRLGFWGGAIVAALVWAALHVYYPLAMQVVLFGMGIALSALRRRTGSLLPGMAWHVANNTVALLALKAMA